MNGPQDLSSPRQLADSALRAGRTLEALGGFTAMLRADPADCYAWYRVASLLGKMGGEPGRLALAEGTSGIAAAGRLLLAIAAQRELATSDSRLAATKAEEVAALFGKGSNRLDRERRAVPPPSPGRGPRGRERPLAEGGGDDPRVLREEALEATGRAAERVVVAGPEPLPFHPLLSELAPPDLAELIGVAEVRHLGPGEEVIEQGSAAEAIFLIAAGALEVTRDGTHLATLRRGAIFGEMALLTASPRTARVAALETAVVLDLDREAVEGLAARNPAVAQVLADYTRRRMLRNMMVTSPLFAPLPAERRDGLVRLFTPRIYGADETVIAEGDESEGLHVVLSGEVRVCQQDADGEPLTLAELGPGEVFGEISLLQRAPATATVTAIGKAVVLCLAREAFNARVAEFPEVLAHVYQLAQQRQEVNLQAQRAEAVVVDDADLLI